jgi:hypothetical protein
MRFQKMCLSFSNRSARASRLAAYCLSETIIFRKRRSLQPSFKLLKNIHYETGIEEIQPMDADARKKLATAQLELVRALVGQEDVPVEFDRSRIEATARALLSKRARALACRWPRLTGALGHSFDDLFRAYARAAPIPRAGGSLADGRLFARELERAGKLPDEGKLEALAFDVRCKMQHDKIVSRKIGLETALLKNPRRLIVALRLPLIGERWLNLPFNIL